jgi:hypothetical protein
MGRPGDVGENIMIEFEQALAAYINGGILPDGTSPQYSADMPGTAASGLTQIIQKPIGDLGFGRCMSVTDDFTADFASVDPNSALAVAQSNYRRLNTPLGLMGAIDDSEDAKEFGFDIFDLLQVGHTQKSLKAAQDAVRGQLLKDDRNTAVNVQILDDGAGGCTVNIKAQTTFGPYNMIMALAGDGSVVLKAITAGSAIIRG